MTHNSSSLIDLFITNDKSKIITSGTFPLSISDHNLIYGIRKLGIPQGKPRIITVRNFKRFNEDTFTVDLKTTNWPSIDRFADINETWQSWQDIFFALIDRHAPNRKMRVRNKPSPWIDSDLKRKMRARDFLKKRTTKTNSLRWLDKLSKREIQSKKTYSQY